MHYRALMLDGGELSLLNSSPFNPRKRALGTHWTGDWVGLSQSRHSRKTVNITFAGNQGT
jgi:hypothetical protein